MPDDILDFLRAQFLRLHQPLDDIAQNQAEHGTRLSRIELAVASLRRDQAGDAETVATQAARIDAVVARPARIERRLDVSENPS